ncbi:MAG: flagellar basal body rod protein FlgC [Deltaproteobacteria bacterium]|nr:flagellar basal body rod protein FlgC [Deltaproteobacteria bacterium]
MADIFSISASGMEAQRLRMNIIASNLANVETTRTSSGGPYRRKDILFETDRPNSFADYLNASADTGSAGVKVAGIIEDSRPLKYVYEPSHPDADTNGYVAYPNVSVAEEMVNMISASRSYDANVSAFKATRDMANKALEIGQ